LQACLAPGKQIIKNCLNACLEIVYGMLDNHVLTSTLSIILSDCLSWSSKSSYSSLLPILCSWSINIWWWSHARLNLQHFSPLKLFSSSHIPHVPFNMSDPCSTTFCCVLILELVLLPDSLLYYATADWFSSYSHRFIDGGWVSYLLSQ